MNVIKFFGLCIFAVTLVLTIPTFAQTDTFSFIPYGGRTLFENVIKSSASTKLTAILLSGSSQKSEVWIDLLKKSGSENSGIGALDDRQLKTLASYLQHNMPLNASQLPKDIKTADWSKILPEDGCDLVLKNCQSCHIITVVVTQDRTREAWLGTLNKPSHVEIGTTPVQREEIADYLVQNAAIPIDLVPEERRAGGATY
jgi:mono/diheme cytochrome c family protein